MKYIKQSHMWLIVVLVLGTGLSALANPANLTVTAYADLVRFTVAEAGQPWRVEILSLAGQKIFDSGPLQNLTGLDWQKLDQQGHPVASGVYLYAVTTKDKAGKVKKQLGKLALVRGQGIAAPPIITTIPSVSEIAQRVGPGSQFDGSGNLLMENDLLCLGNACNAGGRLYDQIANNRTVMQGLGNKVSYVSEDGSKILMQLQTTTTNGRDTALLVGGISGTKNIALLGDTGGNGDVLLAYAGAGRVGIGTVSPGSLSKLQVDQSSTSSFANAVHGVITSTAPGGLSAAVRGHNNGTGSLGIGVYGLHDGSGWGVYGTAPSGIGVYGDSSSGTGVYGGSISGYAMAADGNAWQARTSGGWVKALAHVAGGGLNRCYAAGDLGPITSCGSFSISGSAGNYTITFPFQVNDRFVSVTAESVATSPRCCLVQYDFPATNQVRVRTWDENGSAIDRAFNIVIF
jgi:hypothetical protein